MSARSLILFSCLLACISALVMTARADDWPQWRGPQRDGVWREDGILDAFPAAGLTVAWRKPIGGGYAGPAVAGGRVFAMDFRKTDGRKGLERVLAMDEKNGEILWSDDWPVEYAGIDYAYGPRATPTVDEDRLYTLGTMGKLQCRDADDGTVNWEVNYVEDYSTDVPVWGMVGAPLVDGERLICLVGGAQNAKVVAFNKHSGKEIWRSLSSEGEPGYAPPMIYEAGGVRQLIIWTPQAVHSLDPETGKVYWQHEFPVQSGLSVATPVFDGRNLLVTAFYNGSRLLRLALDRPAAELIWKGNSNSEIETDGLHSLITTPVIQGDYIYGIGSYGQTRCLDARTGKRVWETLELTKENARWACGLIVRHKDRYFINNDRGELVIAKFSPEAYQEISRTKILTPNTPLARKREFGAVNWSHPAYANRHIIARNDTEIVRYSLAAE